MNDLDDIVDRLTIRATIRRQAKDRRSVAENKPDRLADLLEEAAYKIKILQEALNASTRTIL